MSVFRHAGSVDAKGFNGDGRLDLLVSEENPSDQPLGDSLPLPDPAVLDNQLLAAKLAGLEK